VLKAETHLLPGLLGLPFLMCYEVLDQDICIGLIEMEVTRLPRQQIMVGLLAAPRGFVDIVVPGICNYHNIQLSQPLRLNTTPELEDNDTFDGNYLLKRNNWIGDDGTY